MTEVITTQPSNPAAGANPASAKPTTGSARAGAEKKCMVRRRVASKLSMGRVCVNVSGLFVGVFCPGHDENPRAPFLITATAAVASRFFRQTSGAWFDRSVIECLRRKPW